MSFINKFKDKSFELIHKAVGFDSCEDQESDAEAQAEEDQPERTRRGKAFKVKPSGPKAVEPKLCDAEVEAREAELLARLERNDSEALGELFCLTYSEMRSRASYLAKGVSLNPSDLIQEAYMKLIKSENPSRSFVNKEHFLAYMSTSMLYMLKSHIEGKKTEERGEGVGMEELNNNISSADLSPEKIVELKRFFTRLEQKDQDGANILALYYICGKTVTEISEYMKLKRPKVDKKLHELKDKLNTLLH